MFLSNNRSASFNFSSVAINTNLFNYEPKTNVSKLLTALNTINKINIEKELYSNSHINIIVTTVRKQRKKHHKKRINKKWAKRYGFIVYEKQGVPAILMPNNTIYMTYDAFEQLKKGTIKYE